MNPPEFLPIAVDSKPRSNVELLQHVRFVTKDGAVYKTDAVYGK